MCYAQAYESCVWTEVEHFLSHVWERVLFPASPFFTDKEHNALIFHLIAIYILHRHTEGGGETDTGTDGHGHLDHLSLTHNQCQCQPGNSKPRTLDYTT